MFVIRVRRLTNLQPTPDGLASMTYQWSIEKQIHTEQVFAHDGTHQLSTLVIHEILLALQRQETIMPLRHVFSSDDFIHPTALHAFDGFAVD